MSHHSFSDRLIAAEHVDAKRKERYEMEMQKILSQKLTPARRIAYAVGAVFGLLVGVDFGVLTVTLHMEGGYAAWGRAVFGILALLAFVWVLVAGRIAIRGAVNLSKDPRAIARLVWYLSLLISTVALFAGGLELRYGSGKWSVFAAVIGLAYLITGALFVVRNLLQQSELRICQKLLENELRLVEIADTLRNRQG